MFATSVPLNLTLAMEMAHIPVKFEPYDELDDIKDYFKRLELFLTVNGVANNKKMVHLLSGLGAKTYAVLKNLMAPEAPSDCTISAYNQEHR